MGTLRLFLAFCVVNVHAGIFGFSLLPADAAVQAFYVVSGFYMAKVLNEKYQFRTNGYSDFLSSRAMRLFPAFLAVSLLTFVSALALSSIGNPFPVVAGWTQDLSLSVSSLALLLIPQFLIVGLDLVHYFTVNAQGGLSFTPNFLEQPVQLWKLLLVPQGWSLSLELYFYTLAPFIVTRSSRVQLGLVVVSVLIRAGLAACLDVRFDPWSYRFFPSELLFFLSGSIAYRLANSRAQSPSKERYLIKLAVVALIITAGMLGRYGLHGRTFFASPLIIALLFLTISQLFESTKDNKLDRYIGELSYPVYITHMLVVWSSEAFLEKGTVAYRASVVIGVVILSVLTYELIDKRVDSYRHRKYG